MKELQAELQEIKLMLQRIEKAVCNNESSDQLMVMGDIVDTWKADIPEKELLAAAQQRGVDEAAGRQTIELMRKKGEIFECRKGMWRKL